LKVNNEWMNISDLMAGLMMVFLFIAVAFMIEVKSEQESIEKIVKTYDNSKKKLNEALLKEFKKDLVKWGAEITEDNIFRFKSPDVLFKMGSSEISKEFKAILNDFFPRYINLLTSKKYINDIDEIRIEGHTSKIWRKNSTKEEIYLNNMKLSQERANSVLSDCYLIINQNVAKHTDWVEKKLRANGMAYSKPMIEKGKELREKSRRVEFKVLTNADEKISTIIETLKK